MTILPSQVNSILRLYHKMASEKRTTDESPKTEQTDREDLVTISQEAKKKQIQEQTKQEVAKRLKEIMFSEQR